MKRNLLCARVFTCNACFLFALHSICAILEDHHLDSSQCTGGCFCSPDQILPSLVDAVDCEGSRNLPDEDCLQLATLRVFLRKSLQARALRTQNKKYRMIPK